MAMSKLHQRAIERAQLDIDYATVQLVGARKNLTLAVQNLNYWEKAQGERVRHLVRLRDKSENALARLREREGAK